MSRMFDKGRDDALMLPLEDRVRLIEKLVVNLHGSIDPDTERVWRADIARHKARIERGET